MKKITLLFAAFLLTVSVFAGETTVNANVLKSFEKDFVSAKEVVWTEGDHYFKAAFTYNDRHVFAYYSSEGNLLGVTRYLSSADLPMAMQSALRRDHAGYWITDLFEVSKAESTAYYVTLENADTRLVLKAENGTQWQLFDKKRKS